MKTDFSISDSFSQAWDMLKNNLLLILLFFIVCIPGMCIEGGMKTVLVPGAELSDILDNLVPVLGGSFIAMIIEYFLMAALCNAVLTVVNGGKAEFCAFNLPFGQYIKFTVAYFCYILLTSVGMACCIIPGIYIGVKLAFVPMIIIDDPKCSLSEAFKRSWDMTNGNFWHLLGFNIMGILAIIVGLICCCIGMYVAAPFVILATAVIYMQLKEENNPEIEEA